LTNKELAVEVIRHLLGLVSAIARYAGLKVVEKEVRDK
jgi:hypothetical protein